MKIKINKQQIAYINSLDTPEAKKEFLMNCFLHQCEDILKDEPKEEVEDYPSDRLIAMGIAIASRREKSNIEYVDPIDAETLQKMNDLNEFGIIFNQPRIFTTKEFDDKVKKIIEKENLLKFDLPKQESLSKEQLRDITNPTDNFIKATGSNLGWNTNETNEIPKGEINLDAFPATDKFFKEVERVAKFYDVKLFQELLDYEPPHPDKVRKYTKEDMEKCFNEARRYRIEPPNPRDRFWRSFDEYFKVNHQ